MGIVYDFLPVESSIKASLDGKNTLYYVLVNYTVLLYYKYVAVTDPESERKAHRELCESLDLKGRIFIGTEGINGTLAGTPEEVDAYRAAMSKHALFADIQYKVSHADHNPFPKLRIKVRPEVVTLETEVDLANTAPRLTPEEFNKMIEDPNVVLFDARNNYESAIGKFKNAITPDIKLFKDLPEALDQFEDLKDKTVVTYCTGGIRCEKASALMREKGFKDVYQLEGGIVTYAEQFPDGAWEGDCFVFDDRMKVSFKDEPELLGICITCGDGTNDYYNCAYKPCNKLSLICTNCKEATLVCSSECESSLLAISS